MGISFGNKPKPIYFPKKNLGEERMAAHRTIEYQEDREARQYRELTEFLRNHAATAIARAERKIQEVEAIAPSSPQAQRLLRLARDILRRSNEYFNGGHGGFASASSEALHAFEKALAAKRAESNGT